MQRPRGAIFLAGCVIALIMTSGLSYFVVIDLPFWLTRSDWIMPHVYHGRFRLFWIRSYADPIDVVSYHVPVRLRISPRPPDEPAAPTRGEFPIPPRKNTDIPIPLGAAWEVPDFGYNVSQKFSFGIGGECTARIAYFRIPIWLIAALLLLIPLRAAIFGPFRFRRRVRRNLCGFCGYDLTGLPEPRCPECGNVCD